MKLKDIALVFVLAFSLTLLTVSFFYMKVELPETYAAVSAYTSEKASAFYEQTKKIASAAGTKIKQAAISLKPKKEEPPADALVASSATTNSKMYDTSETEALTDSEGGIVLTGGPANITYFNQLNILWKDAPYGPSDPIGKYGCGPTAVSMIATSLTQTKMTPIDAANWAYQNGYHCQGSGSYHSIIPGMASLGLKVDSFTNYTPDAILQELNSSKIIVALMEKGHFATSGHFIILRGTTLDGKILIADPQSLENSLKAWEPQVFIDELKYSAASGGPLWSVSVVK